MEAVLYARNPPAVWGWDCSAGWQQPELATPFAAVHAPCDAQGSKITYWRIFPDWPLMKNPDSYGLGNWELYTKKFSSTCCFFYHFLRRKEVFYFGDSLFPCDMTGTVRLLMQQQDSWSLERWAKAISPYEHTQRPPHRDPAECLLIVQVWKISVEEEAEEAPQILTFLNRNPDVGIYLLGAPQNVFDAW